MHGFLAANKPKGISSAKFLAKIKSALGKKTKVGHTGTLDPLACGLLVVAVGAATRFIPYLPGDKRYRLEVTFGTETDTFDSEGEVVRTAELPENLPALVDDALADFIGVVDQRAPKYSALKHKGVPMYELMRKGRVDDLPDKVRKVRIDGIENLGWADKRTLLLGVSCGSGVYMRSLAHDLGEKVGCGAFMSGLLRESCNGFGLDDAVSWDGDGDVAEQFMARLRPVGEALAHMQALRLDEGNARKVAQGQQTEINTEAEGVVRILHGDDFLGVGLAGGRMLQPRKMMPVAFSEPACP